jgi:hypothetical protein
MSYLINFLFSNLIPIIIVVSVVLRIYGGLKNAAASRRKAASRPVREAEEWDEDETAGEDDIQPRFSAAEEEPPRQAVHQPSPSLVSLPRLNPLDSASSGLIPEAAAIRTAGALPAASPQVPASPAAVPIPVFFRRISALRPMQQALVLSEILGPPRGMNP